jgi:hypothetical protein
MSHTAPRTHEELARTLRHCRQGGAAMTTGDGEWMTVQAIKAVAVEGLAEDVLISTP